MQRPETKVPADGPKARARAPGLAVRPAEPADHAVIFELLRELELDYAARDLRRFLVGEIDGAHGAEIVGIAEVRPFEGFALLSCVGIRGDLQGRGLGRDLVTAALDGVGTDVYLYTLVPGFFAKLGFAEATSTPPGLPPRWIYGCGSCEPARCHCLVRRPDAT